MLFQVEKIGDLCPAPAVNALIIIPHHAKVPVLPSEHVNESKLRRIRILVLVHHHVSILIPAGHQRFRMLVK